MLQSGIILSFLFSSMALMGQVLLPNSTIVQAYMDRNFGYIQKSVEDDKLTFHFLQTSYSRGSMLENHIEISTELEFGMFKSVLYKKGNDIVVESKKRSYGFPREEVLDWFIEEANLSQTESLVNRFPQEGRYKPYNRPIVARILEIKEKYNLKLVGTSSEKLRQIESLKVAQNYNHIINCVLKDEKGFRLHIVINIYAYLEDKHGKAPPDGTLTHDDRVLISGSEYSMSVFFGIDSNTNWGLIRCKTDGIHSYIPVTFAGTKYDYLIDTGASFITVTGAQARELILTGEAEYLGTTATLEIADGTLIEARKLAIRSMLVGRIEVKNILAVETEFETQLFGMSVLRKFTEWELSSNGEWLRFKK